MRYLNLAKMWFLVAVSTTIAMQPVHTAESVSNLDVSNLDAQIAKILPTSDEDKWLTVPWRTNLMKARLEAQNLGRPMFLWIMNGNPMGCT